ncbi:hypothetical protein ANAPC1_00904 [Anaplasma phagocytophilum]|uniref:Uncharacterized protein n=1 Tax=Anaplasma phagocytophilum TaxID=948 RepID=A0AA45ZHN3_ANAPH|nr:hypothetical protein ANAPC1_00904 [Anaplasma phagocytophilum]
MRSAVANDCYVIFFESGMVAEGNCAQDNHCNRLLDNQVQVIRGAYEKY